MKRSWITHAHQQFSLGIGPCSCQRTIFPNLHIACVVVEYEKATKYVVSVPPNSF
jgi:hypothetical protein